MTDPDLDKVVETIKRHSDGGLASLGLIGPAYGSAAGMGNTASSGTAGLHYKPEDLQNIYKAPDKRPRDTVTMGQPLKAWGAPDSFHRTLALHIDTVTFAACGKGILDDDNLSPWVWYPVCALLLLMFGLIVWRFS